MLVDAQNDARLLPGALTERLLRTASQLSVCVSQPLLP